MLKMKVYVDFSASYDRIPHPDGDLENSIAEVGMLSACYFPSRGRPLDPKTHFRLPLVVEY